MRSGRRQGGDGGVTSTAAVGLFCLVPAAARAQSAPPADSGYLDAALLFVRRLGEVVATVPQETLAALSLIFGILFFAVLAAVLYVRARARLQSVERSAREEIGELSARVERAEGLLAIDQNVLVVWPADDQEPEIRCDPGASRKLPARRGDVLAFGKWLDSESAVELERLVAGLRARGESFNVILRTRAGGVVEAGHIEADGRSAVGSAVLRLRDLDGQRRASAELNDRNRQLARDLGAWRTLLDAVPIPAWLGDRDGRLVWANRALARAVGAADADAAVARAATLLDADGREALEEGRDRAGLARRQFQLDTGAGARAHEVWEAAGPERTAGLAIDVAEIDQLRRQLESRDQLHARTLDLVATAIAAFGPDRRLIFHNRSFRQLWGLDANFLEARPGFDEILDRLRAAGRLQEPVDYRGWRDDQLAVFRLADADGETTRQTLWHLPDGRALRVVLTRLGDGVVSALFEDMTRSMDLESRVVALTQVQRETLDSLDEGIAVFGTDGRLKLHNPAFASIWKLVADRLAGEPHLERVIGWCRELHDDETVWTALRAVVTSLLDTREPLSARLERPDRSIVDLRAVPLPDGATLVVFTDVSDTARIERALRDRNEALMTAARIKNEFVHKVSYELRAPLTNIIGFAQLMSDGEPGALSERQREYAGYILSSSSALLAIINDILDLATIDAGVMELDIEEVDIAAAVKSATEGLRDRLTESGISLAVEVPEAIGTFEADGKRIRQILFNLLSNAIGFSEPGQTVRIECRRLGEDHVVFKVSDNGRGIPEDVRRAVFDRFESHALGTRHRGAGLGLSIVKSFVELHGGTVDLESRLGAGTAVTCVLPGRQPVRRASLAADEDDGDAAIHELGIAPVVQYDTYDMSEPATARSDRKERR